MNLYKENDSIKCSSYIKVPAGIVGNRKYNLDSTSILVYSLLLEKQEHELFNSAPCLAEINIEVIQDEMGITQEAVILVIQKLEAAGLLRKVPA